jgi:hypothetical protein
MLRRENIGGFWRIQKKPLPPPPPPQILTQIQNLRTTPINSPSPSLSIHSARAPVDRLTRLGSQLLPIGYQVPAQDGGRGGSEATSTWQSHRTDSTDNESRYALSPALITAILGRVLTDNYNNILPSSTVTTSSAHHQATVSGGLTDESPQFTSTSFLQDHESDEDLESGSSDMESDSKAETVSSSSAKYDNNETVPYEQSPSTIYDSTSDHSDEEIDTIDRLSSGDDCGDDDDDDQNSGGSDGSLGPSNHMRHHVDNPQDVPTPELPSYVFPPTILENSRPGGIQNSSHLEARREKGQLDEVSQAPGAFQQEAPAPAQQSRAVPTALHYRAIKQLNTAELVGLINEFLQQNAARFDAFLARRQAYVPTTFVPKRAKPGSPIKTTFSHTWDSQVELDLLTQAISWLDKLLAPFRTAILKEDQDSLKPRIEQAVREFEATGVPSRLRTGEQWSIADRVLAQHFTDSMTGIRSTNSVRKQLFEYISIDVLTFDNLLSSAENIRYRRDLGREYGQKDDLVDGLRRIYSTIACTIPVGLSEQDPIEQPAQPHKIAYDNDMYYPYELPSRPEIFDHPSASLNSISSTRVTGIQTTGQRTPLRQGYFQKLQADMMGTIAAQRDDEVGIVKMSRNSTSMNRDWEAFYSPIYGSAMANYAQAAARRIESEAREEMLRKGRTEGLQDDSRRSSTEGSDASATSIELGLGTQEPAPKKRSKFCMKVNRPGGCPYRNSCSAESHTNAGKRCKNRDQCKFGAEKCAYIHGASFYADPVPPLSSQRGDSVGGIDRSLQDLRHPQILPQALADPKAFKVCTFVNKTRGCTAMVCSHNHTLKGYICDDYLEGHCPRGFTCILLHKKPHDVPLGLGEFGKGTKRPDLTIDPGSHKNDSQFKNPFQSGAQHSEPMDSEQSPGDRHLPSHTPTEPRSLRQSEPLGKAQHPPFKQVTDTTGSHNVDLAHNDRKRSRSSGQIPWRGGDLVDWMTTEDGQAMTELGRRNLRDQREGNVPMDDLSDYPGDDEDDTNETQRGYRPPKRQKNGKTSHNSRGASGRGRH